MALEIIGAGFGRTGTTSLREALETLGFGKCHHMIDVMRDDAQVDGWLKLSIDGKTAWDELFDGYRAAVDFPSCVFYRELMKKYPGAKVILSIRDPDRWYKSAYETIYAVSKAMPPWLLWIFPGMRKRKAMVDNLVWDGVFQGRFEDAEFSKSVFLEHIEAVKGEVPSEQLLVYEIIEGWEPLCRFLDVPKPDAPFPRVNESKDMKRVVRVLRLVGILPHAALLLTLGWIVFSF